MSRHLFIRRVLCFTCCCNALTGPDSNFWMLWMILLVSNHGCLSWTNFIMISVHSLRLLLHPWTSCFPIRRVGSGRAIQLTVMTVWQFSLRDPAVVFETKHVVYNGIKSNEGTLPKYDAKLHEWNNSFVGISVVFTNISLSAEVCRL